VRESASTRQERADHSEVEEGEFGARGERGRESADDDVTGRMEISAG